MKIPEHMTGALTKALHSTEAGKFSKEIDSIIYSGVSSAGEDRACVYLYRDATGFVTWLRSVQHFLEKHAWDELARRIEKP